MKVQELLNSKDKWTQEASARDKDEYHVSPYSSKAVKWCLLGAIHKCYPEEANKIMSKVENREGVYSAIFNDSHTYEEVMELVRRLDI